MPKTIRDLTDSEIATLKRACAAAYEKRHKMWKNNTPPQQEIYDTAFSDGLKAMMAFIADSPPVESPGAAIQDCPFKEGDKLRVLDPTDIMQERRIVKGDMMYVMVVTPTYLKAFVPTLDDDALLFLKTEELGWNPILAIFEHWL